MPVIRVQGGGQGQGLLLAQVIVEAHRAVVPPAAVLARAGLGQGRAVELAVELAEAGARRLTGPVPAARAARRREAHLALFEVERGANVRVAVAPRPVHAAIQALVHALFQHDVDDAGRAFAIVLSRRRGDNFDRFNLLGRNTFQGFGQVAGQRGRRPVVHQYLEVAGAAHFHVAIAVHGQQRSFAEHVSSGTTGVSRVLVGVVHHAVGPDFHHRLRADDHSFTERRAGPGQLESTGIRGAGRDGYGPGLGAVAHVAHPQPGRAGRKLAKREAALVVGRHAGNGLIVGRGRQQYHRGIGHGLALERVEHGAGERAGGRNGGGRSRRGLGVSSGRQPGTAGQHQTQNEVALHQEKRDRMEAE